MAAAPLSSGHRALRLHAGSLLLAFSLLLAMPARAKDALSESEDSASGDAGAVGGGSAYVDRLIDGGRLAPEASAAPADPKPARGPLRSLTVDLTGLARSSSASVNGTDVAVPDEHELGLAVSGRLETGNYGVLGLDAHLRRGTAGRLAPWARRQASSLGGSVTLSDRDLPLGGGWLADTLLGATQAGQTSLARDQVRFFLPVQPLLGASVSLRHLAAGSQARLFGAPISDRSFALALGEPGLAGGLHFGDFAGLGGLMASTGLEARLAPSLTAGVQAIALRGVRDPYAFGSLAASQASAAQARLSGQAVLASAALAHRGWRLQGNALWSHRTVSAPGLAASYPADGEGAAWGGWLDASLRSGRISHAAGVYYLQPGLSWGISPLLNGAAGGYYRLAVNGQDWRWLVNIDGEHSLTKGGHGGVLADVDLRRRLGLSTFVGLDAAVRAIAGERSGRLLGYVEFRQPLGTTRAEAGWEHLGGADSYRLAVNQNWTLPHWLPPGSHLTSAVSYEHRGKGESGPYGTSRGLGFAIDAMTSPFADLDLDASLSFNTSSGFYPVPVFGPTVPTGGDAVLTGEQHVRSLAASLSATARISPRWNLIATLTDTRGVRSSAADTAAWTPLEALSGSAPGLRRDTSRTLGAYLTLRYALSAGRTRPTVGQQRYAGGGSGTLTGRVYFDANENGVRDAGENGAGGILVILDGIQAIRSDASGLYRFDDVAEGPHRITVQADELPLPWKIAARDGTGQGEFSALVDVGVRSTTRLDIAASRGGASVAVREVEQE